MSILSSRKAIYIGIMALCVLFIILAVFSQNYDWGTIWPRFVGAMMGVIITAFITLLLLKGQSNNDMRLDQTSKVFEERLKIYKDFLSTLCKVIEDQQITTDEKVKLQLQTSLIAMHTTSEHIKIISEQVAAIIQQVCERPKNGQEPKTPGERIVITDQLFKIVKCFQEELDPETAWKDEDKANVDEARKNLVDAYNSVDLDENADSAPQEKAQADAVAAETPAKADDAQPADQALWEAAIARWKRSGWENVPNEYNPVRMTNKGKYADKVSIEFGWYEGHYYVQACYGDETDFAKEMKRYYGGRRSYGTWWTNYAEPYFDMPGGSFSNRLKADAGFQKYIIDWIDQLIPKIDLYALRLSMVEALKPQVAPGDIGVYQWNSIVIDLSKSLKGEPFLSIAYQDGKRPEGGWQILWGSYDNCMDDIKAEAEKAGIALSDSMLNQDMCYVLERTGAADDAEMTAKIHALVTKLLN